MNKSPPFIRFLTIKVENNTIDNTNRYVNTKYNASNF